MRNILPRLLPSPRRPATPLPCMHIRQYTDTHSCSHAHRWVAKLAVKRPGLSQIVKKTIMTVPASARSQPHSHTHTHPPTSSPHRYTHSQRKRSARIHTRIPCMLCWRAERPHGRAGTPHTQWRPTHRNKIQEHMHTLRHLDSSFLHTEYCGCTQSKEAPTNMHSCLKPVSRQ